MIKLYSDIIINGQILAKWRNDNERRVLAQLYLDYYRGVYKNILYELIDNQISDYDESKDLKYFAESEGATEWLINEIALVFAEPAQITAPKAPDTVQEKFSKFLLDIDMNILLENVNQLVELLKDVPVMPIYQNKKLTLKIITPEKCFVHQNKKDPTIADKFFYQIDVLQDTPGQANPVDVYMCYDISSGTLEAYTCTIMTNGMVDVDSVKPVKIPPYKRIPVVTFRDYLPDDSFWYQGNSSIVDKSIAMDMRRTDLAMSEAYHIPMKVFTGLSDNTFKNLKLSRTAYYNIPYGDNGEIGGVQSVTPQDDLKEMLSIIDARRKTLARNAGLSSDTIDGVTATSGYQLALSKQDILNINKRKRKYYTKPIIDLINLAIETAKFYGMIDLTSIKEIDVNYGELKFAQSDEEKARSRAMRIMEGTWSPVMSLMEDDPELTEEEAIELFKRIKEQNDMARPTNPFTPGETEENQQAPADTV